MNFEQTRPHFDPTFNWGHVLTSITLIAIVFGSYFAVKSANRELEFRVGSNTAAINKMAIAVDKLANKAIVDAQQAEQLNAIGRRADLLDHRVDRLWDTVNSLAKREVKSP